MADVELYQELAAVALDLIQSFGRDDIVLRRPVPASYDPAEDVQVPAPDLTQPIKCVVLPASKGAIEAFDNRIEKGTMIESNLLQLKIAAKDLLFQPRSGDRAEIDGEMWTALGCTAIKPAGIPLVYTVTVKRG